MVSSKKQPKPLTISISKEAVTHVRSFASEAGKPDAHIRVSVKGGGCSGLTYSLDLVDEPMPDDKVINEHGMSIFVDKKSYVFLAGTQLEYSGGLNGKGFVFNNPNVTSTCGCGESFAVD